MATFRSSLAVLLVALSTITVAQDAPTVVRDWLQQQHAALGLTAKDATDWVVTSSSTDKKGITYLYIEQQANGLRVHGAVANFAVRDGAVVSFGNRLRKDVSGKAPAATPNLQALEALRKTAAELGLSGTSAQVIRTNSATDLVLSEAGISLDPIPAQLLYEALPDGRVLLAWDLTIRTTDGLHWWHLAVDANSGSTLRKNDYIVHCSTPSFERSAYNALEDLALAPPVPAPPMGNAGYRVFPFPTESPSHGPHTLVTDPADALASPNGWHEVNGAEFTITQGNNVFAFEDMDNDDAPGYSPDGGPSLNFDFPYQPPQAPEDYLDAAITNLFYSCNVLHDVWYHYGFDEESGNFQAFNANGQGAGNDAVIAQTQDGGGMNNANFGTPPDGEPGQMQMYLWRAGTDSTLTINSPAAIAGTYVNALAGFGPPLPVTPLTANIVLVEDDVAPVNDGCDFITNAAQLSGKIALVDRGECTFISKVLALQDLGAEAVIVVNNVSGSPIAMGGSGGQDIVIPSVMISDVDGALIKDALENGPVNGTLQSLDPAELRDSDFDNGIIAHEYGHGVSNRLTGGPDNTDCLWNAEQMGEGWSDWMGLMLTMRPGDDGGTIRGVGTFVRDQENDGGGIRPAPYSTNPNVNDYTYAATNNPSISEPHGIGFIWATMLWDLNWALIDAYGWDPDVYNGDGGNNLAIQLMMDGLKLQPCNPGFVDGRNAILRADSLNNGAVNACTIWSVFAARGLGLSADQGDSFDRFDQTEAFDVPAACSVGINADRLRASGLTLMPNPATNQATLRIDRAPGANATVLIHSTEGRTIRTMSWPAGAKQMDVDLTGLDAAHYIVELRTPTGSIRSQLVVQ